MKKTILLSAFASLSILSCSDDDSTTTMSDSEFKLVTSSNTSGKISDSMSIFSAFRPSLD